jgi:hypothetical protein
MSDADEVSSMKDRGGRRQLSDRRKRTSGEHFPERRWLRYRRSGVDRRRIHQMRMRRRLERRHAFKEVT